MPLLAKAKIQLPATNLGPPETKLGLDTFTWLIPSNQESQKVGHLAGQLTCLSTCSKVSNISNYVELAHPVGLNMVKP
jgi:hypothetical protein